MLRLLRADAAQVSDVVKLHFYTFGGLRSTVQWIADFQHRAR
jgi:hypothetical protein